MRIVLRKKSEEKYSRIPYKVIPELHEEKTREPILDKEYKDNGFIEENFLKGQEEYFSKDENKVDLSLAKIVIDGNEERNIGVFNNLNNKFNGETATQTESVYGLLASVRNQERAFINDFATANNGSEFNFPADGPINEIERFFDNLEKRIVEREKSIAEFRNRFYDNEYCRIETINSVDEINGFNNINKDLFKNETTNDYSVTSESEYPPVGVVQVKTTVENLQCRVFVRGFPILYRKTLTSRDGNYYWFLFVYPEYLFKYLENIEAIQQMEFFGDIIDTSSTTIYLVRDNNNKFKTFAYNTDNCYGGTQANSNIVNHKDRNSDFKWPQNESTRIAPQNIHQAPKKKRRKVIKEVSES